MFKKLDRSYYTPPGWRLATYEEAKNGLENIKEQRLLEKWDGVRLLDGWLRGPGYEYEMGNDFRSCMGYMLVIQMQATESLTSGSVYDNVNLSDFEKEVALFLCVDDWNYEVVYWVLNSWSKSQTMDFADVRGGRIPFSGSDAIDFFKSMNRMLGSVARRLGAEKGYICEKAGKNKYFGIDSVEDVLSRMIDIARKEDPYGRFERLESYFPMSVEPTWLEDESWNTIDEAFWSFLSDSFAGYVVEIFALNSLRRLRYMTKNTGQKNLMIAISILLYLSDFRSDIIHEPLAHRCQNSCAEKILCYAEKHAGGNAECFKQALQNNPMWRCYDQSYDLLNKLLIVVAKGKYTQAESVEMHVVNKLLECGAQTGRSYAIGKHKKKSALHYAATLCDEDQGIKIAESLLGRCDDKQREELVNDADERGRTALHRASEKGHARLCQLLLDKGATLSATDEDDQSPLHYVVEHHADQNKGKDELIKVFMKIAHITKFIDLKDKRGDSPIDIAVAKRDMNIAAKLLSMSKRPENSFDKLDPKLIKQLLRHSLLQGSVNLVKKLFEKGADLPAGDCDDEGRTALHLAAMCDDEHNATDIIYKILGKTEDIQKLVAKCDKRGRTVLHEAALKGYAMLCLIAVDTDPNIIYIIDSDGRNPLYDTVKGKCKDEKLLRLLLVVYLSKEKRPEDDLVDRRGLTPLHVAVSEGKTILVRELLSQKKFKDSYLNRGDILGQTALHKAAERGDYYTVQILLDHDAHPLKERDCDGRTALHYAVEANIGEDKRILLAELLLEKGCKSNEEKFLLLWAPAAGSGTADQNLRNGDLHTFLVDKKKGISDLKTVNLLKTAAFLGDIEMTKELITRGYQIEDIKDPQWRNDLAPANQEKVERVLNGINRISEQGNDQPTILDNLGRLDYAQGLAALFLNPYIKPPIAVGISGSWGMGKSSLMVQTESILLTTAAQMALLPTSKLSSSALEFPDIKPFVLSKRGKKKFSEIEKQINNGRKADRNKKEGHKKDSLEEFLNNYDLKYKNVFKSLAAMDSRDMFTTNTKEDEEHQRSYSEIMWDMIRFKTNVSSPKANAEPVKADSSGEGNVPAVLTVQYNAWKYRNDTEALAGMAVEITKELEGVMTQAQWLSTCWRNTWKKKKSTIWIEFLFPCLMVLVLACSFSWIVWVLLDSDKFKEWAKAKYAWPPAALVIIVWTLTKSVMAILKPVSTQLVNYISFPDHTDKLGYQERVISDITFLKVEIGEKPYWVFLVFAWVFTTLSMLWHLITESWLTRLFFHPASLEKAIKLPNLAPAFGTNLRIIVFVDDLDRCHESVILQVLSAINLVLAECQIGVVLGMDKRLIQRAIIKKYGDVKGNKSFKATQDMADMYLQKIIQLPLDLPDPSEEQSRKFLAGQMGVFENETIDDLQRDAQNGTSMTDPGEKSEREDVPQNAASSDLAINMPADRSEITEMDARSSGERREPIQTRQDHLSRTDGDTSITSNKKSSSTLIREMLFVRYSQGEMHAFYYFQNLATECRKLPREWKRLLNYHRLVWNIFSVSKEAKVLVGWQVQLITWIFICWEWQDNMNLLIENWNEIDVLKTSRSNAPSLLMIVEHFMEKHESNQNKKIAATSKEGSVSEGTISIAKPEGDIATGTATSKERSVSEIALKEKLVTLEKTLVELNKEMNELKDQVSDGLKKEIVELKDQVSEELRKEIKELKDQISDELKKEIKELKDQISNDLKKEIKELKDKFSEQLKKDMDMVKKHSGRNEKNVEENKIKLNRRSWEKMKSALKRYDVQMDGIQAFQRFRFYCIAGYLPRLSEEGSYLY